MDIVFDWNLYWHRFRTPGRSFAPLLNPLTNQFTPCRVKNWNSPIAKIFSTKKLGLFPYFLNSIRQRKKRKRIHLFESLLYLCWEIEKDITSIIIDFSSFFCGPKIAKPRKLISRIKFEFVNCENLFSEPSNFWTFQLRKIVLQYTLLCFFIRI